MKSLKYIYSTFIIASLLGCNDILEPEPQGQVELDVLLKTQDGMLTAVNGVYQPLQPLYQTSLATLTDRASDDGWTWRKETETDIFIVDPSFGLIENVWNIHYRGITRANTVLDRLPLVENFSDNQFPPEFEGQAKFLRAFYYFNLVRLYGGVPLITSEIKERIDAEKPRASIQEVYTLIKNDLTDAIELLPEKYSGSTGHEVGRATKFAALALKAKVHLELEEWSDVVSSSDPILGKKSLLGNYEDNFNGKSENGPESIFEAQFGGVDAESTSSISSFFAPVDFSGGASTLPSDDSFGGQGGGLSSGYGFVQEFEGEDKRRPVILADYGLKNFLFPEKPDGSLFYVHKFYNEIDQRDLSTWNFPIIRYADLLLMRAEAINEISYSPSSESFDLINEVRTRADLPDLDSKNTPNQEGLRQAIRKERRIELSFENNRYFDLNRWGVLEERIQKQMDYTGLKFPSGRQISHPVTGKTYYLYPIPLVEFSNNANLKTQNPGYNN